VSDVGRALVVLGVVLLVVGGGLILAGMLGGRLPLLGRLPGDIHVQRGNWSFHFPLATSLVLSLLLTLLFTFLSRR
jgi:hypothetical protein